LAPALDVPEEYDPPPKGDQTPRELSLAPNCEASREDNLNSGHRTMFCPLE
jgi:hypothetical protein